MFIIYEADIRGEHPVSILNERIAEPSAQSEVPEYANEIINGINMDLAKIDDLIKANLVDREYVRVSPIEKAVLRIGVWEILNTDHDRAVILSEAKKLINTYSENESIPFVHAILSSIEKPIEG